MKLWVKNTTGDSVGRIEVREDVFGAPANPALVHQVLVGQLANARQGTVGSKTRAQVSGGGRKPRPQKGTGRARVGSSRNPTWTGGGVAFGPHPRSYRQNTPKRMRRLSMVSVLSDKVRDGDLVVVDELKVEEGKTSEMLVILDALGAGAPVMLVAAELDISVLRATKNIKRLKSLPVSLLNTLDLLNHRKVVITVDAVRKAEEIWGGARRRRRRLAPAAV